MLFVIIEKLNPLQTRIASQLMLLWKPYLYLDYTCFAITCHECVLIHIFVYEQLVIIVIP